MTVEISAIVNARVTTDPARILELAANQNGLTSPDLKPWYLKATYSTFDEHNQPRDAGTFEEWWVSPTKYKRRLPAGISISQNM